MSARCSQDNAGSFEAAKALSCAAPTDTTALWAYLFSVGGRGLPLGREYFVVQYRPEEETDTPPLDKDELEHLLDCHNALRARRPELTGAQIVLAVDAELKRARRVDQGRSFLSRSARRRQSTGTDRRSLHPGGPARRCRRADPAHGAFRSASDRPSTANVCNPLVPVYGTGDRDVPGNERSC